MIKNEWIDCFNGVFRRSKYYQARVLDKGVTVKAYDDNVTILSYMGLDVVFLV